MNKNNKYFSFLALVLILSIPFYILGAIFPIKLTYNLTLTFLAIFVPLLLALVFTYQEKGAQGILVLFRRVFDVKQAKSWALLLSLIIIPVALFFSYLFMIALNFTLPSEIVIPFKDIPFMVLLYFLGSIPEELAWTGILTEPFTKSYGVVRTGLLIGGVWALWHIIPWSLAHPIWWVIGMCLLNLLMRTIMVYIYIYGGKSLFTQLIFHTIINVSTGLFPNYGSHFNPIITTFCLTIILGLFLFLKKSKQDASISHVESLL